MVGKRLDKLDFSVGEERDVPTIKSDCTYWISVTQHRHAEIGTDADGGSVSCGESVPWLLFDIGNVNDFAFQDRSARSRSIVWLHGPDFLIRVERGLVEVVVGHHAEQFAVVPKDHTVRGSAKIDGTARDRIEDRLQVTVRA